MRDTSAHPLAAVFEPKSVAVIGASADPNKRGHQVLVALRESGFKGAVFPVNPRGGEIMGSRVYPSVQDLPETPELALICVPAGRVPDAVDRCGSRGVSAAVVLAVGFGESGEEGEALATQLKAVTRRHGIRVVGPNTSGILNLPIGLNLIGARGVRPGGLSLIVQSGNIALAFMNEVTARTQEGVCLCVGVGNELDVGFQEYLEFLGQNEATRAIAAYVEGLKNARAFLTVASRVVRSTPVVLLKGARSESGQAAARSHTGAVAGNYDRLRAGLRQAGVVEVTRSDELLHVTQALATQPEVSVDRAVAILSDGGGQGTLAADTLTDLRVPLASLGTGTQDRLRALLGKAAAVSNPVDLAGTADGDPEVFARALDALADDPGVGGVLVVGLFGGYGIRFAEALEEGESKAAREMLADMKERRKALIVHSMYATHQSRPLELLGQGGVPVVESLEVACRCIGELWRRGQMLARPAWDPEETTTPGGGPIAEALAGAVAEGRDTLTEVEARALLSAVGLPFADSVLCTSEDEIAEAVFRMNSDVALKVVSAKIPHKTDAGGVALGLETPDAAIRAFLEIRDSTARHLLSAGLAPGIDGVMVAPMLPTPLAELLVGAHRDPAVGPVLTLGAGGIWVEVLRDVTHRVLPVDDEGILEMLGELRIHGLLTGARGRESADLTAIVGAVHAVARCMLESPKVEEVEINPLFAYADRVVAVDARVFLGG
jgi:acetate---CoA ligase (ADP-forming)